MPSTTDPTGMSRQQDMPLFVFSPRGDVYHAIGGYDYLYGRYTNLCGQKPLKHQVIADKAFGHHLNRVWEHRTYRPCKACFGIGT